MRTGRFLTPVFPGDTLSTVSEVIGLRELSNGKAGVVYVRSTGINQTGDTVLDYARWVMVSKRDAASPAPEAVVPDLPDRVEPEALAQGVPQISSDAYDTALSGAPQLWGDYEPGERIDHVDGMTIEEAEHQIATRLYQNTAKVHFNQHQQKDGRFGRRLIYGGHVISLARALSFNGLANAFHVAAINGGTHVAPCFAGDTVYAWSEVIESAELPGRQDAGALRLRTVATKDLPCGNFPNMADEKTWEEGVILRPRLLGGHAALDCIDIQVSGTAGGAGCLRRDQIAEAKFLFARAGGPSVRQRLFLTKAQGSAPPESF